jgi:hypothetical protein
MAFDLARRGEYWSLSRGGAGVLLKDSKGLRYLSVLLAQPGEAVHVLELSGADAGPALSEAEAAQAGLAAGRLGDAGEHLDPAAKTAYKQRIAELREELEQARAWGDPEREQRARAELEFVARELSAAVGLGGRDRRAASPSERARVNVTRALRAAIDRVREHDGALGELLDGCVRTGAYCVFEPPQPPRAPAAAGPDVAGVIGARNSTNAARLRATRPLQPALAPSERRLVGRASQLDELRGAWEAVLAGGGAAARLVLIGGEAGIGKTRLCGEAARLARARGATVLYGRCNSEAIVPYEPFVEALRHYLEPRGPARAAADLGASAGPLSKILPELADHAAPAAPAATDPEGERYLLFEALCSCFVRAAREAPLLLILDDLHWAEEPTLLALKHLARTQERLDLLVLGTFRTTEHPQQIAQLSDAVAELRREQRLVRIALSGLDLGAVAELIAEEAGREPTLSFAETVRGETEGNPFFVQQVLSHMTASGAMRAGDGPLELDRTRPWLGVPEGVKDVVSRRIAGLGGATLSALAVASVIGREFRLELLEAVTRRLDADELLDALDEALESHLIVEAAGQAGAYSFSHALVRETFYDSLSATRRARLHRRIGEALIVRHAPDLGPVLAALAHHFNQAARDGNVERAIEFGALAAAEASRQLAYEEAVGHYERTLLALQSVCGREAERLNLSLALGDAAWKAGLLELSKETFTAAASMAEALGDSSGLARAALGYGLGLAVVQSDVGVVDPAAVSLLERALERIGPGGSALRAQVMAQLADELAVSDERERAIAMASGAVEIARGLGEPATLAFVLMKTYPALWRPDDPERRLALLREIAELAHSLGDSLRELQAHAWAFTCALELGDPVSVREQLSLIAAATEATPVPYARWVAALVAAMRAQLEGRLEEVEELAQRAVTAGGSANAETAAQLFAVQTLLLRRDQGRLAELLPVFDTVAARYESLWAWTAGAATFYGELGDIGRGGSALARLASVGLARLPMQFTWSVGMCFLAEGAYLLGDATLADEAYSLLSPYAGRWAVVPHAAVIGPIDGALGTFAALMGRPDLAGAHLDGAIAQAEALGACGIAARMRARLDELRRPVSRVYRTSLPMS